jgi:hypothetical protein
MRFPLPSEWIEVDREVTKEMIMYKTDEVSKKVVNWAVITLLALALLIPFGTAFAEFEMPADSGGPAFIVPDYDGGDSWAVVEEGDSGAASSVVEEGDSGAASSVVEEGDSGAASSVVEEGDSGAASSIVEDGGSGGSSSSVEDWDSALAMSVFESFWAGEAVDLRGFILSFYL